MRLPLVLGAAAPAFAVLPCLAQPADTAKYPTRPVRVIVATAAGGGAEATAKLIGQKLAATLGQPFVIEARPGGGGAVGLDLAARATADGHTLAFLIGGNAASMNLQTAPSLDLVRDFSAITQITSQPYVLVTHPAVAATSVKELVALAQAKPGAIAYASGGTGTLLHLAGASLAVLAGINLNHVPFKGGAPALADVVAGNSQMSFNSYTLSAPHIKGGRVRALAVSTSKRAAALPQLPAVAETVKGFNVDNWYGFAAPAKTPPALIDLLHKEIVRTLSDSEVKEKLAAEAVDIVGSSPKEFAAHIKNEIQAWGKVIKQAGIKAQ